MNFDKPRIIALIGKKESGKSNTIKHLILKLQNELNFGLIFTRTKFDDGYNYVNPKYVIQGFDKKIFLDYLQGIENYLSETDENDEKRKPPSNFLVFDDLVGILKDDDDFINFIANHRHYGTHVFIGAQYLKKGVPTTLRECTNYAVMYNTKTENSLKGLHENFGGLFDNFKEFKSTLLNTTKEKFHALLYNASLDDKTAYSRYKSPDVSKVTTVLNY